MTTHAISYESRTWKGWPSMQKASAMLFWRIYAAQKITRGQRAT
jgi:hypothetical protein